MRGAGVSGGSRCRFTSALEVGLKEAMAVRPTRILLADDHGVVRNGFRMILAAQSDMEVVGEASNGREAVEMAERLMPDVVVMDVTMPELNGIEAARQLLKVVPRARVLALSMQKDSVYVREMLRAGAKGYLLKDSTEKDLLAAVCAVVTIGFARKSIHRIQWQSDELDRVSWHMLQSQEQAARRFSHELHDELGQSLAVLRSNLTKESVLDPESLRADCLHLVDESIANVRELSQLLRPVILDDFGLDAGLRWLAERFAQRTRIRVDVETECRGRFADETETHLYRIAQEALTNVARHSKAGNVRIRLVEAEGNIRLSIVDDGVGLGPDPGAVPGRPSLGMVGMRARARQCGGELTVEPAEPTGLRVEAVVPAMPADTKE